jgi:hypothetical protein
MKWFFQWWQNGIADATVSGVEAGSARLAARLGVSAEEVATLLPAAPPAPALPAAEPAEPAVAGKAKAGRKQ